MYKKGHLYFADFYQGGKRKRKSFATAKEAKKHEAKIKNARRPKR